MIRLWKKLLAAPIAAALMAAVLPAGTVVWAGGTDAIYVDGNSEISGVILSGIGDAQFTQYSDNQPVTAEDGVFSTTYTCMAEYKKFIDPLSPKTFSASGKGMWKVEAKYSLRFEGEADAAIKSNTRLVVHSGDQQMPADKATQNQPIVPGQEIVSTYLIDAEQGKIQAYQDGIFLKEFPAAALLDGDITWIRFYPQIILDGGQDAGALPVAVTWDFQYFRVQKMEYAEPTFLTPQDGSKNVDTMGPYQMKFDLPLDPATVSGDTVALEAETPEGFQPVDINVTVNQNVCEIQPQNDLDYAARYRMVLRDGILSNDGRFPGKTGVVSTFTTRAREITEPVALNEAQPVSLTVDGVPSEVLKSGAVTCGVNLECSAETQNIKITAAVYETDSGGAMRFLSSSSEVKTVTAGSASIACAPVTVPDGEQYLLRIFIWDADSGYPYTDTVECGAGQTPAVVK